MEYKDIRQRQIFNKAHIFKSVLQAEKYLTDTTIKKFRDTLIRLRLDINELGVNKPFQPESMHKMCPLCPNVLYYEFHLLFCCPVYADIRHTYLNQYIVHDTELSFNALFKNASIDAPRRKKKCNIYFLCLKTQRKTVGFVNEYL